MKSRFSCEKFNIAKKKSQNQPDPTSKWNHFEHMTFFDKFEVKKSRKSKPAQQEVAKKSPTKRLRRKSEYQFRNEDTSLSSFLFENQANLISQGMTVSAPNQSQM